jgi:hypothetical protein
MNIGVNRVGNFNKLKDIRLWYSLFLAPKKRITKAHVDNSRAVGLIKG